MKAHLSGRMAVFGSSLALVWSLLAVAIAPVAAANPAQTSPDADAACAAAPAGHARCFAMISRKPASAHHAAAGVATPNGFTPNLVAGYGPAELASAYSLPTGGTVGAGMTVAVVDAFDQPNAEAHLAAYRTLFGLPPCTTANGCFKKVNQSGATSPLPPYQEGWATEIDLDVQMVSAACPNCKILLVEAGSDQMLDLAAAEVTAVNLGAVAVANSYGTAEAYGEVSLDPFYNHPGVAIVASSGDCGYNCAPAGGRTVEYPAASQFVIAVGGTTLNPDASDRGWSETAWGSGSSGAGSGCSLFEPKPGWQSDSGCATRMVADISAVADPNTGMAVYTDHAWQVIGGTSAAAPIIAGIYGLAGGVRAGRYPARDLYSQAGLLHDVVGGSNDLLHTCTVMYFCNGVPGYDGPTGLGTPRGLVGFTVPAAPASVPSTYHAVTPTRLLDTRSGIGLSGAFQAGHARTFTISGGLIPADATAVTGNLTVTQQTYRGWLYAGPEPLDTPGSSTLNFLVGDDRANNVTVPVGLVSTGSGTIGTLSVTYGAPAGNTAQVIFDVTGYFKADASGATYHALQPARLVDTRIGQGIGGALTSKVPAAFQVAGVGGVPADAIAVTGNLTVTAQTAKGFLYLGPDASDTPTSSTLNFPVGDDRANGVSVPLTPQGTLGVTYVGSPSSGPTTHVVFDVTGYYTPGAGGASYVALAPRRILDTRYGTGLSGPFWSLSPRTFAVAGGDVPASASAVTGNLTVTQQTSRGWVFVGPAAVAAPTSSTLNFPVGDDRANGVTVGLGSGTLSATFGGPGSGSVHVIFDLSGYFTP